MGSRTPGLVMIALMLLGGASPLTAQWRTEPNVQFHHTPSAPLPEPVLQLPDSVRSAPSTPMLAAAGVAGAWGGVIAGALLGSQIDRMINGSCELGCENHGRRAGFVLGPALLAPLSVHYANGRRGSLTPAYLSAALIAGVAAVSGSAGDVPTLLIFTNAPWAHAISAVIAEQKTAQPETAQQKAAPSTVTPPTVPQQD